MDGVLFMPTPPKALMKSKFKIQKSNDDSMLAFSYANMSMTERKEFL